MLALYSHGQGVQNDKVRAAELCQQVVDGRKMRMILYIAPTYQCICTGIGVAEDGSNALKYTIVLQTRVFRKLEG